MKAISSDCELYEYLTRRCADLGVWLWSVTQNGAIAGSPSNWPGNNIQAAEKLVRQIAQSPLAPGAGIFFPIEQGMFAMKIAARPNSAGPMLVAIAWEQADSQRAGRALGLGAEHAAEMACGLLKTGATGAARLTRVVSGLINDVISTHEQAAALEQFGERLTQSYEEINALLRVAGSLKGDRDVQQSLKTICSEVQHVLGFSWVIIRFTPDNHDALEISDNSILAGAAPCATGKMDSMLLEFLNHETALDRGKVLSAADSELARIAGTEVIVQAILHDGRRIGLLAAGGKSAVDPDVTSSELRILCAAAELIGIFHENACRFEEHRAMFLGTLRSLTASIDAKDPYTRGHSQRVALLAGDLAAALGFDAALVERYRIAGLVHDAGKIGVPEAVLCKCGRLTEAEFALIKRHPEIGYGILKDIPGLADVLSGVLHHHERWDGQGYPHGLGGESIPLMARVLALADTFDAMSSDRSYRKRIAREQVLAEIRRCAGTQFDPALAAKFVSLSFAEFDKMFVEQSGVAPLAA